MKKIVHICLTGPYISGMGYHENILSSYHVEMGYEVFVISFCDLNIKKTEVENNIVIERLVRGKRYGKLSQFGDFPELIKYLYIYRPELIYVHNPNFISYTDVIRYKKRNPTTKVFVDNHNDFYNAPIIGIKSYILNKIIFRKIISYSEKYVEVFWGVTPWRCEYLNEVYGVSNLKIKYLEMGGDDRYIDLNNKDKIRNTIRSEYGIDKDDFVLITGGKINKEKGIDSLVKAVNELEIKNLKLFIFGRIEDELHESFDKYIDNKCTIYVGWKSPEEYYNFILASDLAIFPGTHSVLWEQVCACGIPIAVKDWKLMHHIDLGGNAFFISDCTSEGLSNFILNILNDKELFEKAKSVALEKCVKTFSYKYIAKKAICEK